MRAEPAPRLFGAAEQEVVIAELLEGWQTPWPRDLADAVTTRHFTRALRDLLLRALERDVTPEMLAALGRVHRRPVRARRRPDHDHGKDHSLWKR